MRFHQICMNFSSWHCFCLFIIDSFLILRFSAERFRLLTCLCFLLQSDNTLFVNEPVSNSLLCAPAVNIVFWVRWLFFDSWAPPCSLNSAQQCSPALVPAFLPKQNAYRIYSKLNPSFFSPFVFKPLFLWLHVFVNSIFVLKHIIWQDMFILDVLWPPMHDY